MVLLFVFTPEAKAAFDQIVPGQSTTEELECLGYDPFSNPNVKILTYLDVTSRFIPNNSIQKSDLLETVRKCLEGVTRPSIPVP